MGRGGGQRVLGEDGEPFLELLVEEYVEACVRRVSDCGGAEAGEEAFQALGAEDVSSCAGDALVGVETGFVSYFYDGHGHEYEAGSCACDGARGEVGEVGEFGEGAGVVVWFGGGGGGSEDADFEEEVGMGYMAAQSVERGEVDGRAEAGAEG